MLTRLTLALLATGALILFLPRLITALYAWPRIYSTERAPAKRVAIVFGAGLWFDGGPSPVLRDRIVTAANLYFSGKVEKLLFSGDNPSFDYNEPLAMKNYALSLGVPDEKIVLDYAGRRTYDTCYRAQEIFGVRQAILVTQKFHLPRALFLCNALKLEAVGVPADVRQYRSRSQLYWNLREVPATLVALWEVYVTRPLPVLGNPEPIFKKEV